MLRVMLTTKYLRQGFTQELEEDSSNSNTWTLPIQERSMSSEEHSKLHLTKLLAPNINIKCLLLMA